MSLKVLAGVVLLCFSLTEARRPRGSCDWEFDIPAQNIYIENKDYGSEYFRQVLLSIA